MKKQFTLLKVVFGLFVVIGIFSVSNANAATPVATVTSPANGTTYTVGNSISFTYNLSGTYFSISSVQYYLNTTTAISSPYTATTAGTYTIIVKVSYKTSNFGSTTTTTSAPITIYINSAAPAAPVTTGGSTCGASTALLSAVGTPGGGTFNWYTTATGGTAIAGITLGTYTPTVTATKTYYVSYTLNGLESNRSPVTATVNSAPVFTSQPANSTICAGSATSFSVAASGSGLSYQWYSNGAAMAADHTDVNGIYTGSQTATLNITPGSFYNAATFYCVVTSSCGSITSNTVTLTVNPLPSTSFTATPSVGVNNTATIVYTGTDPASSTYTWDFNGGTPATGSTQGPFAIQWPTNGTKTVTLTVTNASGCTATSTQTVTTVSSLTSYGFSMPVTINASAIGLPSGTSLTNFPALVYIKDNSLITTNMCNDKVQYPLGGINGYDFAFTVAGTTTELPYQVENYDHNTGTLLAWVQIPELTNANANLTFYFGSLTPAHNAAFTAGTWTSDYLAVYHFNDIAASGASATPPVLDATSNAANGTPYNLTVTTDEIHTQAGLIAGTGGGYKFVNSSTNSSTLSSKIITTTHADITASFTLSAWVNVTNPSGDNKVISNELDFGPGYKLSVKNGVIETETRSTNNYTQPGNLGDGGTISANTWHHIQGVFNSTTKLFTNYLDGVPQTTTQNLVSGTNIIPKAGYVVNMGMDHGDGTNGLTDQNFYNGNMDEVRISNVVKSPQWILAEYYNQANPTTFTTCGPYITYQANAVLIPGALAYNWTGAASTDPSVAANWDNVTSGVPGQLPPLSTGTAALIIPVSTSGNYPKLTSNISAYGFTVASGASFLLNGYTLNVACNIYNTGTGKIYWNNNNTSTINWDGSTPAQSYNGSTTGGFAQVGTMIVNNSSAGTVTLNSDTVDIYSELTLTKGNLAVASGGILDLRSNAAQSATVDPIPTSYSITGNVNVERYITGNNSSTYRGYRLLSSPVNINSVSALSSTVGYYGLSYLTTTFSGLNRILTAGPGGAAAGFDVSNPNPLIYLYDETLPTNNSTFVSGKNIGVIAITGSPNYTVTTLSGGTSTSGVKIPVGNSFLLYYVGSNSNSTITSGRIPDNATSTSVGYLNQGTIPVTFWKSSSTSIPYDAGSPGIGNVVGYNQVGNPYASTISLDQVYADNYSASNAISPIFWEMNEPGDTYISYNSSTGTQSSNRASKYIVSGQGFIIDATAKNQTLTFKEDQKVSYPAITTTTTTPSSPGSLQLSLKTQGANNDALMTPSVKDLSGLHLQITQDSITYTQTGIYFNTKWADQFNTTEDAMDLDGAAPKVYLSSYSSDGARLSINQLGDYSKGKTVKLFVKATTSGLFKLSLVDISNIDTADYDIYLRDHHNKDSLDIRRHPSYNFNIVTTDTTTYGANRFDLVIDKKPLPPYKLISFTGQKATGSVQLNWKTENEGNYTGFALQKLSSNGRYTDLDSLQSNGTGLYDYTDSNPVIGGNTYRLQQNDISGIITYSLPVTIVYDAASSVGAFSIFPNPSKNIITITIGSTDPSPPNYLENVYNTAGKMMKHKIVSANSWTEDVSNYKLGVYIVEITTVQGTLIGKSKFIKVE